jgi:hypothetical protein
MVTVQTQCHLLKVNKKTMKLPSLGSFLIMTDISANQFLFEVNEITACVDLDVYVIGPREWELALLENYVKDMDCFKVDMSNISHVQICLKLKNFMFI